MKKTRNSMWMAYKRKDFKCLNEDTHNLSLNGARFEVYHSSSEWKVWIQVRCYKDSRIFKLCESMGYVWTDFQGEV